MRKTTKILICILSIVLIVQTAVLFNLLRNVNTTYIDMTHSHSFMLERIDSLTGKVNELKNEHDVTGILPTEDNRTIPVKVSGYFTATVRSIMPDYTFDDTTPMVAVVTCFQSTPFTVWLGENLVTQVKPGETYNFEIIEKAVELNPEYIGQALPSPEISVPLYGFQIASVTVAGEDDYGLESYHFVANQY